MSIRIRTRAAEPVPVTASRRRASTLDGRRRSPLLTVLTGVVLVYSLLPLFWLVVSATKSQQGLFSSFGLWFADDFNLWRNVVDTLTYDDGIFLRWLGNTLLYVCLGAGGEKFW